MKKSTIISRLSILTALHFLVDFVCVFCVCYIYMSYKEFAVAPFTILVYDCIAFLTQPFIGMIVDKDASKKEMSAGLAFVALVIVIAVLLTHESLAIALILKEAGLFVVPILLGFANSTFHVIGGKEVLVMSDKSKYGGIYVSSGAFGLGLGVFLSSLEFFEPLIPILISVLLIVGLTIAHWLTKFDYPTKESPVIYKTVKSNSVKFIILIVLGVCLAIAFRSLLGYTGQNGESIFDPKYVVLIAAGCAVLGKALGGVLQDFFGARVVIILSTILGVWSLALPGNLSLHPCIFVFSVNLLMPITLDVIRRCLPKREGFAFGLTAAFVLIGYLLYLLIQSISWLKVLSIILVCVTGVVLFLIDYFTKKKLCETH